MFPLFGIRGACTTVGLLVAAAFAVAGPAAAQTAGASTELYRFVIVQAAPGRLADLIDLYTNRAQVIRAGGDELPFIVRHSQGDHWDLVIIYPSGNWSDYYSRERIARREAAANASGIGPAAFAEKFYSMISWHEDIYVQGPPLEAFQAHVKDAGLLHFEMMQALPGKRDALIEERRMENAYNRGRNRGETLIFVHDQGAAWDVITLAAYRNWRHYAESETIPKEVSDEAARKAGFRSAADVPLYMRTLISTHRDTLGPPVPLASK